MSNSYRDFQSDTSSIQILLLCFLIHISILGGSLRLLVVMGFRNQSLEGGMKGVKGNEGGESMSAEVEGE